MNLKYYLSKYGLIFALLILIIFFSTASDAFLSSINIFNVLRQVAVIGITAVGMTIVILTGGIDLSVGSVIAVSAVLSAYLMTSLAMNPFLAAAFSLSAGVIIGFFIGFLINKIDIPPLIATLGMMLSLRGVAYVISGGLPIYGLPESYTLLGQGYLWVIPIPVIVMAFAFLFGYILLNKTVFGRHVYGIGGNEEASRLSGVSVEKVIYKVYGIAGFLSATAGLVLLSRVNSGQPNAGNGYEFDVITAVVLGGISITGGVGSIVGVIVGVLIMGVLSNGMILLNVNEYYQWIVKGMVLLAAVGLDRFSKRKGTILMDVEDNKDGKEKELKIKSA